LILIATVFTIGFTKKSLRQFIQTLRAAGVQRVVDVRLRNTSQLAGWTKLPDFAYLLEEGFGLAYEHHPEFAPSDEILDRYKSGSDWMGDEEQFNHLLRERGPEKQARELLAKEAICLLCADLSSALNPAAVGRRLGEIERGEHKLVYIAPERFDSPRFQQLRKQLRFITCSTNKDLTSAFIMPVWMRGNAPRRNSVFCKMAAA
jgi:hypothetical protein